MMIVSCIALILTAIGAFNWFALGVFNYNFISAILPIGIANALYIAIGLSGLWLLVYSIVRMATMKREQPVKRVSSRHSA